MNIFIKDMLEILTPQNFPFFVSVYFMFAVNKSIKELSKTMGIFTVQLEKTCGKVNENHDKMDKILEAIMPRKKVLKEV